jgi:hypothetical protein
VVPGTTANFTVVNSGGAGSNSVNLPMVAPLPTPSLSPTTGYEGERVTIHGSGFGATPGYVAFHDNGVNWGAPGNAAPFTLTSWSDSQIVFQVPTATGPGGQGTVWSVAEGTTASLTVNPPGQPASNTAYLTIGPPTVNTYSVTGTTSLNERSGPSTNDAIQGQLAGTDPVPVMCQATGQVINGTAIWDQLTVGWCVSDDYVSTPNFNRYSDPPIPQCSGFGPSVSGGTTRYPPGSTGYDIGWPQCGADLPGPPYTVAVVQVSDGNAFSHNPCLATEAAWGGGHYNLYLSINSPPDSSHFGGAPTDPGCAGSPLGQAVCQDNYSFGWNDASDGVGYAQSLGIATNVMWWLDVEPAFDSNGNPLCTSAWPTGDVYNWECDSNYNDPMLQGALDYFHSIGVNAGSYSTGYQWGFLTDPGVNSQNPNAFAPQGLGGGQMPIWIAGDTSCGNTSLYFAQQNPSAPAGEWLIQTNTGQGPVDTDAAC